MLVKAIQEMCITHVQEFKKIYLTLFFTAKFLMLQYIIQAQEDWIKKCILQNCMVSSQCPFLRISSKIVAVCWRPLPKKFSPACHPWLWAQMFSCALAPWLLAGAILMLDETTLLLRQQGENPNITGSQVTKNTKTVHILEKTVKASNSHQFTITYRRLILSKNMISSQSIGEIWDGNKI